jgi:biotin-dependent carboxylase-like uncharacterized protein
MRFGLSRGGAADRLAMAEGAVLLGQSINLAALEMAGYGGVFEISQDARIALTGAPMKATVDDQPLVWNAVQWVKAGQRITIGASSRGVYGYLHVGGGIATDLKLGSRSSHITAGIGKPIAANTELPIGTDANAGSSGIRLPVSDRFSGGIVRVSPSAQTARFSKAERARFEATQFVRSLHGNRQGIQLEFNGASFTTEDQLSILSEAMVPGDIQMTGNGNPFVLLPECQTTGGYPRIGTVLPQDLPIVAQAAPGAPLQFNFVSIDKALETALTLTEIEADLKRQRQPLIRDPYTIHDLLSYQLISGVTAGRELSKKGDDK